jgi:hypothetical protein
VFTTQDAVFTTQDAVFTTQDAVFTTQDAVFTTQDAVSTTQDAVFTTLDAVFTTQDAGPGPEPSVCRLFIFKVTSHSTKTVTSQCAASRPAPGLYIRIPLHCTFTVPFFPWHLAPFCPWQLDPPWPLCCLVSLVAAACALPIGDPRAPQADASV